MYRNKYQRGMITVFFSCGSKPFALWDTFTKDGFITRFMDQDLKSMVCEISGTNVSTTYMICPKGNTVLGITMPFLVMIVKNLKKYFSFEVTVLDETNTRRRFRVSNFQSTTQINPLCTVMPIGLSDGWNQIQFNIAEFMQRAYKKQFTEVLKLKINANIRLRRIYFTERLLLEDELPAEYKLYFPIASKNGKGKRNLRNKEAVQPLTSEPAADANEVRKSVGDIEKMKSKSDIKSTSVHGPMLGQISTPETAVSAVKLPAEEADAMAATGVPSAILEEKKSTMEAKKSVEALPEEDNAEALAETPAEIPAETPGDTPAETAGDTPAETPGETPAETLAEPTAETPAETPAETVTENLNEIALETPAEIPTQGLPEPSAETPVEAQEAPLTAE